MERILLLNDKRFPGDLVNVKVNPPTGMSKISYVENEIIDAINKYNPKLDVKRIDYLAIETQFSHYKKSKSNGALIEEFDILPSDQNRYTRNGCYVYMVGTRCICRRIMLYVFVSGVNEDTRTAFISQTVFPTLLEYADEFMQSPSYTLSNHKFCFINILNKKLNATMILRHLAGLCAAGMDYVEVFSNYSFNPRKISADLKLFLEEYSSDFNKYYNSLTNIYEDDNYLVDFKEKNIIWQTTSMISKLKSIAADTIDFNGSGEKFYWIEILPISIFAYKQGYKVDYSEYEKFVRIYKSKFSETSEKFKRCEVLLEYAKKYFI
ncbi:MAG: hypothetical protein RR734_04445 [Bacilli bacterium]